MPGIDYELNIFFDRPSQKYETPNYLDAIN